MTYPIPAFSGQQIAGDPSYNWGFGQQPWQGSPSPYPLTTAWTPAHHCSWLVVSAQAGRAGRDETLALLRCTGITGCGSVRTERLEGAWSLRQLRGEDIEESPAEHVPAGEAPENPSGD